MTWTVHVIPDDDATYHEPTVDCVCGPTPRCGCWIHHSLDGREHHEPKETP